MIFTIYYANMHHINQLVMHFHIETSADGSELVAMGYSMSYLVNE